MALHGTRYENKGYAPRCPVRQLSLLRISIWHHNCSGLDTNETMKGVLQGWVEGRYQRWTDYTWWGLQQDEVQQWVLPNR